MIKVFLPKHCSLLLNFEKLESGYALAPNIRRSFCRVGTHAFQNRLADLGCDG